MRFIITLILAMLVLVLITGSGFRMTKEEHEKADKYQREYIYIDEELELKENSYTKTLEFTAKSSSGDRFYANLFYKSLGYINPLDEVRLSNINESLVGFNFKLYDKSNKQLIYSYSITRETSLLSSLGLGSCNVALIKGHEYVAEITIPSKKDSKEEYLKPTLVVGILLKPHL